MSLNLSLKQLRQASFITRCQSVFRRHEVSPTCFELEITETTLMVDPKRTIKLLDELYAMGLHLSIDDFGTGYSSLSALQQFPIGTLKIDQSFVRDAAINSDDATIVRTIIDMGKAWKSKWSPKASKPKSSSTSCATAAATTARAACSATP